LSKRLSDAGRRRSRAVMDDVDNDRPSSPSRRQSTQSRLSDTFVISPTHDSTASAAAEDPDKSLSSVLSLPKKSSHRGRRLIYDSDEGNDDHHNDDIGATAAAEPDMENNKQVHIHRCSVKMSPINYRVKMALAYCMF